MVAKKKLLISLDAEQLITLNKIKEETGASLAEIIRRAINEYVEKRSGGKKAKASKKKG